MGIGFIGLGVMDAPMAHPASRLQEAGAHRLDAPVSDGEVGAKAPSLAITVGGPRQDFERGPLPNAAATWALINACSAKEGGAQTDHFSPMRALELCSGHMPTTSKGTN